eukprot:g262.t1
MAFTSQETRLVYLVLPAMLSLVGSMFIFASMCLVKDVRRITPRKKQILFLSVADIGFSIFCIANVVMRRVLDSLAASDDTTHVACTIHGFLMEYFASMTWLWSNCIALTSIFTVFRMKERVLWMDSKQHYLWLFGIALVVPGLVWRAPLPGTLGVCEPADVPYLIFTAELSICFLFNYAAYLRVMWHMRAYAPESVRERFSNRTQTYLAIFLACWSCPFVVGVWMSMFDGSHMPSWIVKVALITQSLQGFGNAFAYGYQENIAFRAVWSAWVQNVSLSCSSEAAEKSSEEPLLTSSVVVSDRDDENGGSKTEAAATSDSKDSLPPSSEEPHMESGADVKELCNQCDTITLSCATTPEGHILIDVTNNRTINATSPVLVMSDSNGDGTADGNDVDANWFCPSLELAYGQVPFTGLPGQSNIACDENRSYAPDSEATRALNISNFCLSNCDPDTGFVFSLIDDCSQPVLGIIVGCVSAAILFMLVGICYLQIQLHRERERQAKENLEKTEKLLQANVDDVNLLSSGWILSKDEVKFVQRLAAGSEGEVYATRVALLPYNRTLSHFLVVSILIIRARTHTHTLVCIRWRGTMRGRYEVAIKKVFDKKITLERNDEIRFLQRARHPRLVMFLGCGYLGTDKHDGIFVVLEFCEYGSLTSYVIGDPKAHAEKKGLPEERSWSVRMSLLDDVAEGMAYLHLHHKSVHRGKLHLPVLNLKADNVLLSMEDESGVPRAKVADFGLSRLVEGGRSAKAIERERELKAYDDDFDDADDDADSSTTKGGSSTKYSSKGSNSSGSSSAHSTASSPAYMAPEIIINLAKNVHRYGQPVDVYAFAIIMYEVLELHPAWFEKSYTHYIFQDVEEGKRPPISREADAPSTKYCTLMKKCWGSDPALRPTFDVILDVVREIRGDMARDRRLVSKSASVVPPKASAGEGSKSKTPVSQIELIVK